MPSSACPRKTAETRSPVPLAPGTFPTPATYHHHHHGRRRRGLQQAPPLPLLCRRGSDLHQGHQHLSRLRAQEGGLSRRLRRRSCVGFCSGARTSACNRRSPAGEALTAE